MLPHRLPTHVCLSSWQKLYLSISIKMNCNIDASVPSSYRAVKSYLMHDVIPKMSDNVSNLIHASNWHKLGSRVPISMFFTHDFVRDLAFIKMGERGFV